MPINILHPGVYVQELSSGFRTIAGVNTSIAMFVGRTGKGKILEPVLCTNLSDFEREFSMDSSHSELPQQVKLFYENGGSICYIIRIVTSTEEHLSGDPSEICNYNNAFEIIEKEVDIFNLLVLPKDKGDNPTRINNIWSKASVFCKKQRAFLLIDAPDWETTQEAIDEINNLRIGLEKDYCAIFFPKILVHENGIEHEIGLSGAIAGLIARIDTSNGVWKAPAGNNAEIRGVSGLNIQMTDIEYGLLNKKAINNIRSFSNGIFCWGARTLEGDDDFQSEYKYIPVRRLALFIEESIYRGLKWAVFEPNDESLWAQIRLNVRAFMNDLFREGAFQGQSPRDAFLVKCDKETTNQNDINLGIVNIRVGFAPLKPAEFIIISIQQIAGQVQA